MFWAFLPPRDNCSPAGIKHSISIRRAYFLLHSSLSVTVPPQQTLPHPLLCHRAETCCLWVWSLAETLSKSPNLKGSFTQKEGMKKLLSVSKPWIIFKCLQINLQAFFSFFFLVCQALVITPQLSRVPCSVCQYFFCQSVQQFHKTRSLLKYPEPLQHRSLLQPDFSIDTYIIYFFFHIKTPASNIPLELKVAQLGAKAQLKHHVFLQDSAFVNCITIEIYSTNPWVGWGCV